MAESSEIQAEIPRSRESGKIETATIVNYSEFWSQRFKQELRIPEESGNEY